MVREALQLPAASLDPLVFEIESLRCSLERLAETNRCLNPEIPADKEQMFRNILEIEDLGKKISEMSSRLELRLKPSPARERYLRLVVSK